MSLWPSLSGFRGEWLAADLAVLARIAEPRQ